MEFKCTRKNCPYKKEIEILKEEIALLRFELEQIRDKRYKSNRKGPKGTEGLNQGISKKRGGIFGHTGWFRKKPKKIDKTENVKLVKCPECGSGDLRWCKRVEEHIQEDIILPKVEVTLFRKYHYYCKSCKKVVTGKGENELLKSYLGPNVKALAAYLKYGIKISELDIQKLFDKLFGLKIACSSITGFKEQLRKEAYPIYEKFLQALRLGKFVHADETGWRVNGENNWLWKFSNKKICVSHIDKSRGQKVVEDILGKGYGGILISDFLSAYNKITTKAKQRCLVHILRDLKKVIQYWHDDKEVIRYCTRLKRIFENAIELYKEYEGKTWNKIYYRRRKRINQSLIDFYFPNPNKKILVRFVKRLNRHKKELFTFLYRKDIDYHNNHAEQQIRPDVIFRKITFGNRSLKGVENHNVLMSILQTAKLNGLDPINTLHKIISVKKNPFAKILAPP